MLTIDDITMLPDWWLRIWCSETHTPVENDDHDNQVDSCSNDRCDGVEKAECSIQMLQIQEEDCEIALWKQATASLLLTTLPNSSTTATLPPFVCQKESWDCGVACLQMVLLWLESNSTEKLSISRESLIRSIGTKSVWTADLVLLLESYIQQSYNDRNTRHPPRYLFCTKSLQVNPDLQDYAYYSQAFDRDRQRVQSILETLQRRQDQQQQTEYASQMIQMNNLSILQVKRLIEFPNCVAIALVDNSVLVSSTSSFLSFSSSCVPDNRCKININDQLECGTSTAMTRQDEYVGHFILLLGTSHDKQHVQEAANIDSDNDNSDYCFLIYNPACSMNQQLVLQQQKTVSNVPPTCLSPSLFERAWSASGTDKDILFVVHSNGT